MTAFWRRGKRRLAPVEELPARIVELTGRSEVERERWSRGRPSRSWRLRHRCGCRPEGRLGLRRGRCAVVVTVVLSTVVSPD